MSLSTGSLTKIFDGQLKDEPIVVQYLGHKELAGNRYRLSLWDGETTSSYTVLSIQNNHLITDGSISLFAVCRISKYLLTKAKHASVPIIVVMSIEVVVPGEEVGQQIVKPEVANDEYVNTEMPAQPPVPENTIATVPISSLSPYYGRWTIKARVTSKSDIRYWNNARGEGKFFSMDLIDESAEIRCTGFKEQCDSFFHRLEVGRIYYITRCTVKPANKRFTNIKHEFELVLNSETIILNCEEDSTIPMIQFDFISIDTIETKENDSIIDLLAVVKSVSDLIALKAKATGRDVKKRDIELVDDSNTMVVLTLWGAQAEQFDGSNNPVVAIKAVKITEFNGGRSLNSLSSTIIQANPVIAEADRLLEWFHESGQAQNARLLSNPSVSSSTSSCPWLTIRQAKDLNIGSPGNPNMYITKATVNLIRDKNCIYKACPTEGCNKKLSDLMNGMYNCEKCQTDFPRCDYRMIVQAIIVDWTGDQRVTVFGDEAEKIMGMNAKELAKKQEELSTDAYKQIFLDCAFKSFTFKIRMKQETFNNETRLKATVINVTPVDDKQYGSFLVNKIKALLKKKNPSY